MLWIIAGNGNRFTQGALESGCTKFDRNNSRTPRLNGLGELSCSSTTTTGPYTLDFEDLVASIEELEVVTNFLALLHSTELVDRCFKFNGRKGFNLIILSLGKGQTDQKKTGSKFR